VAGKPRTPFPYHDTGIMAMISLNAAVGEVGERRHEVHGSVAVAAWLGVHAYLMCGARTRVEGFIDSIWTDFTWSREPQVLDRSTSPASAGRKTKMWPSHPHFPVLPR
jgi:NADH dehydrogenase